MNTASRLVVLAAFGLLALGLLAGCGGSSSTAAPAVTLKSIAINPSSVNIPRGATQQFTAMGTFSDNSTKDITATCTWTSSNTALVTVNAATGLATAVASATIGQSANISCSQSGVNATTAGVATVVAAVLSSIAVTASTTSVDVGATDQFTATGHFTDGSTSNISNSVTWNPNCNPAGAATISNTGLATGVATGSCNVTASQSSITSSPVFILTVTAVSACSSGPTTLCGQFSFLAQGSAGTSDAPVMIAGTFTADGKGGLTAGVLSFNSDNLQQDNVPITNLGVSSAWQVGADGRGTISLATSSTINGNGTVTFAFALNSTGNFAFIFESDDTSGTGLHQSGYMQAVDKTRFNAASITGGYALGLVGGDGSGSLGRPRAAMLAAISASGSDCGLASNGNGVFIVHDQGMANASPIPFTCTSAGLTTIDPGTGHGTVQFTFTGSPFSSQVMNFGFYVIDATKVIFISTDVAGANFAILSGTMYKQAKSSFSLSDMACGFAPDTNSGCVFATSGESGLGSHISAGRAVGSASGSLTLQSDDNKAGTVTSATTAGFTVTVSANGVGTIAPPAGSPAGFVLIDTDTGILGFVNGSEEVGLFKPQTTLAVSTTLETFILGSQLVADGKVTNATGVVTLATPTSGNLAGKLDFELPVSPFEVSGSAITGTYALDSPATGRGTGTSNIPGLATFIIWTISSNEIIVLDSDSTVTEPVLIDLIKQ